MTELYSFDIQISANAKKAGGVIDGLVGKLEDGLKKLEGEADVFAKKASAALGRVFRQGSEDKKIEKIRKEIRAFDELKTIRLSNPADDSGKTEKGENSLEQNISGNVSLKNEVSVKNILVNFESEINNLTELEKNIESTITNTLENKIDWKVTFEGAKDFGIEFALYLKNLISPELFLALGVTIANSLSAAFHAAFSADLGFDFKNLLTSISVGVNRLFAAFDFSSMMQTLNVWALKVGDTIKNSLTAINWEMIWTDTQNSFQNLEVKSFGLSIEPLKIEKLFSFEIQSKKLSDLASSASKKIGEFLASKLGLDIEGDASIGKVLLSAGKNMGKTLLSGFQVLIGQEGAEAGLASVNPIIKGITGVGAILGGAGLAVGSFFSMWQDGWNILGEILKDLGIALAAVGAVILGAPAAVAGVIALIVAAVSGIVLLLHEHWDGIVEWFSGVLEWISENLISPIIEFFRGLWETIAGFFSSLWETIVLIWNEGPVWFYESVILPIIEFFKGLWEQVLGFFSSLWEGIVSVWSTVSGWFCDYVVEPVIEFFRGIWSGVSGFFSDLWEDIKGVWRSVSDWFNDTIIEPVSDAFQSACDAIGDFFSGLWSGIKQGVAGAMNAVIGGIEGAINWIVDGINAIIGKFNEVVDWAGSIIGANWGGLSLIPRVSLGRIEVSGYETGGFPKDYSLFIAGERGRAEMLGTIGGKTAVAGGEEITGIRDAIFSAASDEKSLLKEQNQLLRALLEKEQGISYHEVFHAARKGAYEYFRRTGNNALAF